MTKTGIHPIDPQSILRPADDRSRARQGRRPHPHPPGPSNRQRGRDRDPLLRAVRQPWRRSRDAYLISPFTRRLAMWESAAHISSNPHDASKPAWTIWHEGSSIVSQVHFVARWGMRLPNSRPLHLPAMPATALPAPLHSQPPHYGQSPLAYFSTASNGVPAVTRPTWRYHGQQRRISSAIPSTVLESDLRRTSVKSVYACTISNMGTRSTIMMSTFQ